MQHTMIVLSFFHSHQKIRHAFYKSFVDTNIEIIAMSQARQLELWKAINKITCKTGYGICIIDSVQ